MSYTRQPRRIPLPFLRREVGAGDAVAGATTLMGIEPCAPCQRRKRWLNRRLQFVPTQRARRRYAHYE